MEYIGKQWNLVAVDGVPISQFKPMFTYDTYCDRFSRSPGETVGFVLEDLESGERRAFQDVKRRGEHNRGW